MRFTRVSEARYYYASRLGKARVVLLRDGGLVAPLHAAAPLVEPVARAALLRSDAHVDLGVRQCLWTPHRRVSRSREVA